MNINKGGYLIPEDESKKLIGAIFKNSEKIKAAIEEFNKTKGPLLWAEYQKMIDDGVSKETAFNIIRAEIWDA